VNQKLTKKEIQLEADADWIFVHVMQRKHYTAQTRDKLTAYLDELMRDSPARGGKIKPPKRGRPKATKLKGETL